MHVQAKYSNIQQFNLEQLVHKIGSENLKLGETIIDARLAQLGFLVQRSRLRHQLSTSLVTENLSRG